MDLVRKGLGNSLLAENSNSLDCDLLFHQRIQSKCMHLRPYNYNYASISSSIFLNVTNWFYPARHNGLDLPRSNLPRLRLLNPDNLITIKQTKRIKRQLELRMVRTYATRRVEFELTFLIASTVASPNS
jgi:hypothetical protein